MTHARACCCGDTDPGEPCAGGEPFPSCLRIRYSGMAPSGNWLFDGQYIAEANIYSISGAVSGRVGMGAPSPQPEGPARSMIEVIQCRGDQPPDTEYNGRYHNRISVNVVRVRCNPDTDRWEIQLAARLHVAPGTIPEELDFAGEPQFRTGVTSEWFPIGGSGGAQDLGVDPNGRCQNGGLLPGPDTMGGVFSCDAIDCDSPDEYPVFVNCDDPEDELVVDMADAIPGAISCRIGSEVYTAAFRYAEGDPITPDEWFTDPCPELWPALVRCDGGQGRLPYDPATRPTGARTTEYQGVVWTLPSLPITAPGPVTMGLVWSLDDCPIAGPLYERCRPGVPVEGPFGTSANAPDRIRVPIGTDTNLRVSIDRQDTYTDDAGDSCRAFFEFYYRNVVDDGGSYPTINRILKHTRLCSQTRDRYLGSLCDRDGIQEPDDPIRPDDSPAGSEPTLVGNAPPWRSQIPVDFDPEAEARRLRRGGCCDPPNPIE